MALVPARAEASPAGKMTPAKPASTTVKGKVPHKAGPALEAPKVAKPIAAKRQRAGGGPTPGVARRIKPAEPCSIAKTLEILALATADNSRVRIDCSLTLGSPNVVISKRLEFRGDAASGVRFDCNGATIDPTFAKQFPKAIWIYSWWNDGVWSRPQDVAIRNCRVRGKVAISSRRSLHSTWSASRKGDFRHQAQAAAPRFITLDNLKVENAIGWGVYFASGVTRSKLLNSEVKGHGSTGGALYLDHESAHNLIKGNFFDKANTNDREQVAVDGSAHNKIVGNRFHSLNTGGIYVYRNCGEDGVVRHQRPRFNQLINNVFYYNKYEGDNPAIHLARRNGGRSFCDLDDGVPFGSGKSDLDFANNNVVAENRIIKRKVSEMICENASPNYYFRNQTVSKASNRESGCYMIKAGRPHFIGHGEHVNLAKRIAGKKKSRRYRCEDNRLVLAQ